MVHTHTGHVWNMLALAVSGGADSLALAILARDAGLDVVGLSVDHTLRGATSAREARHVARWFQSAGLQHMTLTADWQGTPLEEVTQELARRKRYSLLSSACLALGIRYILTGHHADDQAETISIRQETHATQHGLAGMFALAPLPMLPSVAPAPEIPLTPGGPPGECPKRLARLLRELRLVRPMLPFTKAECEATCLAADVPWAIDPSNYNPAYHRVRVREALAEGPARRPEHGPGAGIHLVGRGDGRPLSHSDPGQRAELLAMAAEHQAWRLASERQATGFLRSHAILCDPAAEGAALSPVGLLLPTARQPAGAVAPADTVMPGAMPPEGTQAADALLHVFRWFNSGSHPPKQAAIRVAARRLCSSDRSAFSLGRVNFLPATIARPDGAAHHAWLLFPAGLVNTHIAGNLALMMGASPNSAPPAIGTIVGLSQRLLRYPLRHTPGLTQPPVLGRAVLWGPGQYVHTSLGSPACCAPDWAGLQAALASLDGHAPPEEIALLAGAIDSYRRFCEMPPEEALKQCALVPASFVAAASARQRTVLSEATLRVAAPCLRDVPLLLPKLSRLLADRGATALGALEAKLSRLAGIGPGARLRADATAAGRSLANATACVVFCDRTAGRVIPIAWPELGQPGVYGSPLHFAVASANGLVSTPEGDAFHFFNSQAARSEGPSARGKQN
ncbi:hypothetical protein, variant [Fonticula alba]|uniref:tRNA(Ile)-lysidine synthetase n=1 Tax=Fonticula alba TaxID=691883 RepID=A0A058ZCB2_FONAL|nr:hypothetical protein, variant [Fonticula alba]KCV71077.1 hypothetical protein, variant [Fonticula alba]|eukprot:XP_009494199.1 hypothetical protein, variant [Fonticula alba]